MRKSRILGYALTLAATLVVGGAMGQVRSTNYVEIGKTGDTEDQVAAIQVGKKYGFFVTPDQAYHPKYDNTSGWLLTSGFTWVWTGTGLDFAPATPVAATGLADDYANFVEIKAANKGKYTAKVIETAPSAWNISCTDAGKEITIYAFDEPSFTAITTGTDAGDAGKRFCKATDVSVFFNVKASGTPHFKYTIKKVEGEIKNAATGEMGPKGSTFTDVVLAKGDHNTGLATWNWDAASGTIAFGASTPTVSIDMTKSLALDNTNPALAEYKVGIKYSLPLPGTTDPSILVYRIYMDQVNGVISRNGDHDKTGTATTESFYPTTAATDQYVDVYMVKAPKTGPVYHISNNKAA